MAIAPEVAAEYSSLTDAGAAPGASTLRQAEANVAGRRTAAPAPSPAQRGSRARTGGSQSGGGTTGGTARAAYGAVSSPSQTAQTLTRLIWAVALGLIVLEIASEATGQYWDFRLPAAGSLQRQPYQPLYGPSSAPAALPGLMGNPGAGIRVPSLGTNPVDVAVRNRGATPGL